MEIEIDLNITLTVADAYQIQDILKENFTLTKLKTAEKFSLQSLKEINGSLTIDQAIADYLKSIKPIRTILTQSSSLLRVGVFFFTNDTAALSMELSQTTIQALATYQLALDVTCYPCSKEK